MKPIALITGASGGIGSAIALKFAEAGYAVVLQYRSNLDAAETCISSFPQGTDYLCMSCDLDDAASTSDFVNEIRKRMGAVSVLVNCAGIALPQKLFSDTTDDDYTRVFTTNVLGTLRLTRLLTDDLRKTHGAVVNLSSMWGVSGASCEVLYSASKAAIIGFTKALAKELAPSDVTVNCVAPGFVPTRMNQHLSEADAEAFRLDTPLQRLGTPQDIADAVFYLSQARFVTGQVLCCDGGFTL